jgi:hypothetical protein
MKNFYIATSFSRAQDHNRIRDLLVKNGYRITYDWTLDTKGRATSREKLLAVTDAEIKGVLAANTVVVLLPGGNGTHAELGIALGAGKKILLHCENGDVFEPGEKACTFYHHPNVTQIVCGIDDKNAFLRAIEKSYEIGH